MNTKRSFNWFITLSFVIPLKDYELVLVRTHNKRGIVRTHDVQIKFAVAPKDVKGVKYVFHGLTPSQETFIPLGGPF